MNPDRSPGEPFVSLRRDRTVLWADRRLLSAFVESGLDRPDGWVARLGPAAADRPGRGATTQVDLGDGCRVVLKALARGGVPARLWGGFHWGSGRLLANLTVPWAARARGVRTPAARALLIDAGPLGLRRGWLAVDALEGRDLDDVLRDGVDDPDATVRSATRTIEAAHDAGLRHPDLNLGNLFVDLGGEVHLLDLDGARLGDRPVGAWRRMRELTRLARSWRRRVGDGNGEPPLDRLLRVYGGERPALARRMRRLRPVGRAFLAMRSIGRRAPEGPGP